MLSKLFILSILCTMLTSCSTWDRRDVNKALWAASTATLIADWGQTRYTAANPDRYYEKNKILGEQPSLDAVDRYFTGAVLLNTTMFFVLPEKWQTYWFAGLAGFELFIVGRNHTRGIKFNFGM